MARSDTEACWQAISEPASRTTKVIEIAWRIEVLPDSQSAILLIYRSPCQSPTPATLPGVPEPGRRMVGGRMVGGRVAGSGWQVVDSGREWWMARGTTNPMDRWAKSCRRRRGGA